MHSGSHVSVRGGDDPRQKIKSSSTILANSGPATVHLFKAAEFSVSPAAPSLPSIYRFMGMIQRYRRKALLCLLNYKRATTEFCMCTHLDACMAAHTSW